MKKPLIPAVPKSLDLSRTRFDAAVKERLEIIGGERSEKIALLPSDATLEQVVGKINEVVALFQ